MKEQIEKTKITLEDDEFFEEALLYNLSHTQVLSEASFYMDDLLELVKNTENPNTFSKIEGCVKILKNSEKDLEIRKKIVEKLLRGFYPFLNSDEGAGERIETSRITEVANSFGEIILNHDKDDDFKEKCGQAFIETVVLNEKF